MPPVDQAALERGSKRLDEELSAFAQWATPNADELQAMKTAVRDMRAVVVGLPEMRTARVFIVGSMLSRTMLPCSPGIDLRVVGQHSDHTAVLLSLAVARLLRASDAWKNPACDAGARSPALWATHIGARILVRVGFVTAPQERATTVAWSRTENALRRLVFSRPPSVRVAALLFKALAAANGAADAKRGIPGLAAMLLAGCALAEEPDAKLAVRPCAGTLLLWDWFSSLPTEGVMTADPSRDCVTWRGTTCEPMRVVVRDPEDPATNLCAGANAEWWARIRLVCNAGIAEFCTRTQEGLLPGAAALPGTFLQPAQWVAWQLAGRFAAE